MYEGSPANLDDYQKWAKVAAAAFPLYQSKMLSRLSKPLTYVSSKDSRSHVFKAEKRAKLMKGVMRGIRERDERSSGASQLRQEAVYLEMTRAVKSVARSIERHPRGTWTLGMTRNVLRAVVDAEAAVGAQSGHYYHRLCSRQFCGFVEQDTSSPTYKDFWQPATDFLEQRIPDLNTLKAHECLKTTQKAL